MREHRQYVPDPGGALVTFIERRSIFRLFDLDFVDRRKIAINQ